MFISELLKKNYINLILFITVSYILYILIYNKIIYPTIIPIISNGNLLIFNDWIQVVNANFCFKKGFDVYILNNTCGSHTYGKILLQIPLPFFLKIKNFYFFYLPLILNLIFIYVSLTFFKFKKKVEYFTIIFFIFSASFILVIERANLDIVIFLLMTLISYNRNIFFNYLILIFVSLAKFYPVSLMSIFLFEKNIKKIFINCLLFLSIISLILYFQLDELSQVINTTSKFISKGIYVFSFKALLLHLDSLKIAYNGIDYSLFKYLIFIIITIVPFSIFLKKFLPNIISNTETFNLFKNNEYVGRLYILASSIILLCYFSFSSNFIYREIFFLGLIPWIISAKEKLSYKNYFNFYFYSLCIKFFLSSVLIYFDRNGIFLNVNPLIILIKYSLDFYIISIMVIILIPLMKSFIKIHVPQKVL